MADTDSQGYELQDIDLERNSPPIRKFTGLEEQIVDVSTSA